MASIISRSDICPLCMTRLAYMTDEAKEGRDAFLEKRKPNFEKKWIP
jgi:1,4-dihydroxy-2-naphthoyl-CoA synthase